MLPLSSLGLMGADSAPTEGEPSFSLNFAASNTLDPRVTFSRASNATYVDSAGNLAYAPSNLLTYSEQFDNAAWAKNNSATITANSTVAPDGATTADTFTTGALASSGVFRFPVTISGAVHTVSVYLKNGSGATDIRFGCDATPSNACVRFNAVTRLITSSEANVISSSVTDVGNGWDRLSVSFTATSTTVGLVLYGMTGTVVTFNAWGAQLNLDGLQSYNSTTVKNLLGYTQEFENAAWTKSNSFIQTNLLTYSEQFDNAAWGKVGMTVTANAETAPNNTVTGDKLIPDVVTGLPYAQQTITVVSGTNYAWSVYLKAAGYSWVFLDAFDGANHRTWFDLSTGTIGTVEAGNTATITDVGNGWYRCTIARSSGGVSTAYAVAIVSGNNDLNITGNGVSGVFAWGAQLVQGTTPGDYQATTTTTLPVQYRAPDGSLTADKVVENTVNGNHVVVQVISTVIGAKYTGSIRVKAAERSQIRLVFFDGATSFAVYFDLGVGVVGTTLGAITPSIQNLGSGWFVCSGTFTATATSVGGNMAVRTAVAGNDSYTGDGTSGIYIWGAQLSDSASLDPYVYNFAAAPAAAAYYGPRFDHNPSTLAPLGLLIEEQRTNSIRNNTMQGAVAGTPGTDPTNWSNTIPAGITQQIVGTGTESGITYIEYKFSGTATGSIVIRPDAETQIVASSGQAWAGSTYVRLIAGTLTNVSCDLNMRQGLTAGGLVLNTSLGFTPTSAALNTQRIVNAVASMQPTTERIITRVILNLAGAIDFTLRIGLPQLELGAFATSVIPTTTAAATRAADVAAMQGANFSNWYNPVEGTLFAEASVLSESYNQGVLVDIGAVGAFGTTEYINRASSAWILSPNTAPINVSSAVTTSSTAKIAAAIKANDSVISANGLIGSVDTTCAVPLAPTTLSIGKAGWSAGSNFLNGYIRRIAYYPRRLSNNELQAITT